MRVWRPSASEFCLLPTPRAARSAPSPPTILRPIQLLPRLGQQCRAQLALAVDRVRPEIRRTGCDRDVGLALAVAAAQPQRRAIGARNAQQRELVIGLV